MIMPRSLLFDQTKDPAYIAKRKELSGAFFKSKLIGMTKIIKEVTLIEIKALQDTGASSVDVGDFIAKLQARIIINIAVGKGYSDATVDFEEEDGTVVKKLVVDSFLKLITQTIGRSF
jgi:cytochrome P450